MNVAGEYGEYSIKDGEIVFAWPDTVSISREDLWKEIDADWEVWKAQEYARKRATEYPDMGDQLDYIFHNGVAKWKTDIIEPVKTKYPKPS